EIDAVRLGLAFEPVEAIEQQVVVKPRPAGVVQGRNRSGPKTEGAFRVSLPAVPAEILANKLAALVEEDAIKLLARLKPSTGHLTATGVGLNLIFGHAGILRRCPI